MQREIPEAPGRDVSKEELDKIIRHHVWGAMGVGLIPAPLIDIAALTGIQLNLLRKLGNRYNIPFSDSTVRKIIASLVSSVMPAAVAPTLAFSIAKIIPFLGQTAGVVTMPLVSGAATYALGKVFIQHFESGGTFLTFDPEKVKAYYAEMFQEGEHVVTEMQTKKPETSVPAEAPEQAKEPETAAPAEASEQTDGPEKSETPAPADSPESTTEEPEKPEMPEQIDEAEDTETANSSKRKSSRSRRK